MKPQSLSSRNWFGKASAGTVAGFFLALAVCGVLVQFGPLEVGHFSAQAQVAMWLMAPLWAVILSFCFLFHSGVRAWAWLGGANGLLWGLLYGSRLLMA